MICRTKLSIAILLLGAGCSTDQPKAAAAVDAGAPPPPAAHDAGLEPDAGVAALAASQPAPAIEPPPDTTTTAPPKGTVYDRLLAKPKVRGTDPQEIKALIEKKTGLKVELTRRTAGSWVMIQLVAVPGGRDEKDQRKAIDALKALGVFEVVEGDRLMKVKMP